MNSTAPPAEDDDEAYVFFDHRELESSIVAYVSEHVAPEHALTPREDGEDLFVTYRGQEHRIPLTISPHDRYVAISSLAELLKHHYRFFVLLPSHDTDTHAVLVVPIAVAQGWGNLPAHLAPLRLGFDYFHQLDVPYLNHEASAPNFASESEGARASTDAFSQWLVSGLFSGKADPNASAALAKAALLDPKIRENRDFPKGMSEAEIAAEIQKAMEEALRDPEVVGHRRDMDRAMQELRNLITPKKPWWKVW